MAGSYWPFPGGEPVTNGLNLGSMLPAVLTGFLVSSGRSRFFTRRLLHGRLFARRSAWGKSTARAPAGVLEKLRDPPASRLLSPHSAAPVMAGFCFGRGAHHRSLALACPTERNTS